MITDTDKGNIGVELKRIVGDENVYENEPMRDHTTFKIGGEADFLVTPETIEQVTELLKFFKVESKALYYSNARKAFSSGQWLFKGLLLRFSDDHCFGVIYHSHSLGLVYGYDIIPSDGRCLVRKREERDLSKWSPIGILKYEIYQILHHLKIFDSDGSIKDFDSIYEKL